LTRGWHSDALPRAAAGYDALFEKELAKYTKLKEDALASVARNDKVLSELSRNAQVRQHPGRGAPRAGGGRASGGRAGSQGVSLHGNGGGGVAPPQCGCYRCISDGDPARPAAPPLPPAAPQAFQSAFQVSAWRSACEAAGAGMRGALKAYREVLEHLSEGLRFYMSLQARA
jgi:hypothetical protein